MKKTILLLISMTVAQAAGAQSSVPLDGIVAVVNDDVVLRSELDTRTDQVRGRLEATGPLPSEAALRRQVLERLIMEKLQMQRADELGITIPEDGLNQYLAAIARQNEMTLEEWAAALAQEGLEYAQVREDIRADLIMQQLRQREVVTRIQISRRDVDAFLASSEAQELDPREFRVSHIMLWVAGEATAAEVEEVRQRAAELRERAIAGEDFAQLAVANSQGQQALEGGDLGWRRPVQLPTIFAEQVVSMQPGDISDVIRTPGAVHLIRLEDVRGEQQRIITEQTRARHILLRTGPHMSDRRAQERLSEIHERIVSGEDFGDLARRFSEDEGSAIEGGELGWIGQGETAGPFQEAMDELQPGEMSEPFQSQFGWHIVEVLERREYDATEETRVSRARQIIGERRMGEEMERWLQRLRDDAYVETRLDT